MGCLQKRTSQLLLLTACVRCLGSWLAVMVYFENTLLLLTVTGALCLLGFGGLIAVLFIPISFDVEAGRWTEITNEKCNLSQYNASLILFEGDSQYPPRVDMPGMIMRYGLVKYWVAHWCTPAQWWFNVCVKYFSFYFGFVNALPLPWTLSVFLQVYHPRRNIRGKTGVDFYVRAVCHTCCATTCRCHHLHGTLAGLAPQGKKSESIWFHLPLKARMRIATINLIALIVQIPDCICRTSSCTRLAHASAGDFRCPCIGLSPALGTLSRRTCALRPRRWLLLFIPRDPSVARRPHHQHLAFCPDLLSSLRERAAVGRRYSKWRGASECSSDARCHVLDEAMPA